METQRAALPAHAQPRALLDAVLAFSGDLQLADVLEHVVHSACELVGAKYGALGMLAPDGDQLVEFVTHGISDLDSALIGGPPKGLGVLGLVTRDVVPLRLHDVTQHLEAHGFPPHHPLMHSFIGVPIRVRDEVLGNLYLTEKDSGEDFTAEYEATLVALASAAGVAIDNARLFDRIQQRERWSEALGQLIQALLEAASEEQALTFLVDRGLPLTGAEALGVAAYDATGHLAIRALTAGEQGGVLSGAHWETLLGARQSWLWMPGADATLERVALEARAACGLRVPGPTALVPIAAGRDDIGLVIVGWSPRDRRLATEVLPTLTAFVRQAALALVAARAQRDSSRLALLEERDRIARDMHDNVVQTLFATGLSLQSAAPLAQHPVVRVRVLEAVDAIDSAIKEIREAIFELHQVDPGGGILVVLEQLVEGYAQNLGFVPELVVEGRPGALPETLRSDAVAVVRECLTNVARHARAARVSVLISVTEELEIAVGDDGVGMGARAARSGLVNLRTRAAAHHGSLTITTSPLGGALVRWTVPLER